VRAIFVLLAALGGVAAQAQEGDSTVVIAADGLSMTKAEFEHLFSGEARYRDALGQPGSKLAVGRAVGKAFALEAEARRRKIDQAAGVQLKIRNYTQQLLAYELLVSLRTGYLADEAALTRYYEAHRDSFDQPRVRQLLVRATGSALAPRSGTQELSVDEARAKADALREKIVGGVDFAELAKAESDDLGSRDAGGDIGFVARGAASAEFEAVAYSLPVGVLSEVVQTGDGFCLLRVEERRPLPFELTKAMIANDLAHNDMDAIVQNGYKLNAAYFGE
jgi:hypothetical protein